MAIPATGAQTIGPTSGGKVTAVNTLGQVAIQVIGQNVARQSLLFHNPGTNSVYVAPMLNAQGVSFTPSSTSLGGTFEIAAGGYSPLFMGEIQGAWQAFASTGSNQPLTVMESNV